jgi:hypothetical protein
MAKWIRFEHVGQSESGKTSIWRVVSTSAIGVLLGEVRWYGPWRKYSFFPNQHLALVFEKDCLRDIADFTEAETNARKKQ